MREHEALPSNPTVNVDWYRSVPRKAALPVSQLHRWYTAVMAIENPIRRDFLRFALFTGLRRTNATEVRWEHVDFENRTIHIPKPKSQRPFDLPLSDFLVELLEQRKRENAEVFEDSPWVFPSLSATGHMTEPKETFEGITWTTHDCRRWFITVAESLDVSPYAVKLLVNHAMPSGDVTGGYIQHEVERLRPPMQAITNRLLALCMPPEGKVRVLSAVHNIW
jgi:integrase